VILELSNVSLSNPSGSRYLLEDISFTVNQGDRLGIIGPVGAGKTSLLKLLNKLQNPQLGKISFQQQDIAQIPSVKLRSMIALVPQEPKLLGMSVAQALAYPLQLQNQPRGINQEKIDYWREQLDIPDDWLERNELQLSLGQRQKVAIARALVTKPKILVLDEPTSSLDVASAHHLIDLLIQQTETQQTTVLMVNHQLNLIQKFAQRIIWLEEGKLYQDIAVSEINWQGLEERFAKKTPENLDNC